MAALPIAPPAHRIVLDTNVVLDWLAFRDPGVEPLRQAIEDGSLGWLVCARMREEFEHMIGHRSLARWSIDAKASMTAFDRWSRPVEARTTNPPARLRCSDPDDQVFVDLATAHAARWLVTRDRALLKLARHTKLLGLDVLTPQAWAAQKAQGRPKPPLQSQA